MEQQDGAAEDPESDATPQPVPPDPIEIERAARAWGVETDYWDIWGKQHHATPDLETAILGSLGVDLRSKTTLQQAIERRSQRQWRSPLAPAILLTAGGPHEVLVSLPASRAGSDATLRIQMEDGRAVELKIAFGDAPTADTLELDGRPLMSKRVRLPDDLPLGLSRDDARDGRGNLAALAADCLPEPGL